MIQIDVVAGARPNFMKVAPILRELARRGGPLAARFVHTGQHYDDGMSEVFLRELGIPRPDRHLGVGSGPHGGQTGRILASFEEHLLQATPRSRGVVVVGDVNSTLACTLAAVKLGIPVAHVEAGLRSYDRTMPEEVNRVLTDAVAELRLVSDPAGETNLAREGIREGVIYVGNVMIDSLANELAAARALQPAAAAGLAPGSYAYLTLHRPHNVDSSERLAEIVDWVRGLGERLPIVFPIHPRTRERLQAAGLQAPLERAPGIHVRGPLGYRESLGWIVESRLVLTDSGGVQEETSYLGIPCLTLRPTTERPVTVELGTNTIVGSDLQAAEREVGEILAGRYKSGRPIPGWDGQAAGRIVDALERRWASGERSRP